MTDTGASHSTGATVRAAGPQDATALSQMLARAFFDDPLMCFLLSDPATRPAKMVRLFKLLFRLGLPHGGCDVTTGVEAAALWRPPGAWHIPFYQYLTNGPEFLTIFGAGGAMRAIAIMDQIERRHPKSAHYYLQIIGTDPQKQGRGFGGVAIRRHLAIADQHGAPCYLESSKDTNIPIYRSFGFQQTGVIALRGGPTLFPMWREARG